jgi:hypothetical protein
MNKITDPKGLSDKEKSDLIEEVRTHPALWEQTNTDYANTNKRTKAWLEIADVMRTENREFTGILFLRTSPQNQPQFGGYSSYFIFENIPSKSASIWRVLMAKILMKKRKYSEKR